MADKISHNFAALRVIICHIDSRECPDLSRKLELYLVHFVTHDLCGHGANFLVCCYGLVPVKFIHVRETNVTGIRTIKNAIYWRPVKKSRRIWASPCCRFHILKHTEKHVCGCTLLYPFRVKYRSFFLHLLRLRHRDWVKTYPSLIAS